MASKDPLKTVISLGGVDDTSLALPSVNQFSSGRQRVKEQVQTIRRTKSRHVSSRSGSTSLSPTSPSYESVFGDNVKLQSSDGSVFFGNGFSKALNLERNASRYTGNNYMGSNVQRNTSSAYYYRRGYAPAASMAAARSNTSRSEPDLAWQRAGMTRVGPPQRLLSNMGAHRSERSIAQSRAKSSSQPQPVYAVNGTSQVKSSQEFMLQRQKSSRTEVLSPSKLVVTDGAPRNKADPGSNGMKISSQLQPVHAVNGTSQVKSSQEFMVHRQKSSRTEVLSPSKLVVTDGAPQNKADPGSNEVSKPAEMTMKEAVECLSKSEETYQSLGASYIQHNAFNDDKAREEVLKLDGVPPLVNLLRSPSLQVRQAASAALWNLSFKSDKVKEAINHCDGITGAVALLKDTESVEIQKQLTGLLWNLSSAENLKPDLLKSALPILMERVILPYTAGPDQTGRVGPDPDVFFHATSCLRNLSSGKQSRQNMRKCRGLVESLVRYISNCVKEGKPDDKSVENSICILHNLTFQLEVEAPSLFKRITALAKPVDGNSSQGDAGPISCFSPQNKPANHECQFDFAVVEDPHPIGAVWLFHSITLQSYLSLLSSSQQEDTQEASCGAMLNLTTREGIVSNVMSQTIVQKLNGLSVITPLIRSNKINLQKSVVALVGNLTKNRNLNNIIARKALPELVKVLMAGTEEGNESDDTLAMACLTVNSLLMNAPEMSKYQLTNSLINSLRDLCHNPYFPKSSKAAGLVLYNLWSEKDFQSYFKKIGMSKALFVNDVTTAAHRSFHVVQ